MEFHGFRKFLFLFFILSLIGWCGVSAEDIDQLLSKAKSYQSAGMYEEALTVYNQILAISPDNPDVTLEKMEILWKLGDYEEANGLNKKLATIRQNSPEPRIYFYWRSGGSRMCGDYLNKGIDLMIKNRFDEAFFYFNLVREYCPDYPNMVNMLCDEGYCFYMQGKYEMAIKKYDEAINLSNSLIIENPGDKGIERNKQYAEIDRDKIVNKLRSLENTTSEVSPVRDQNPENTSLVHTSDSLPLPATEELPVATQGTLPIVSILISLMGMIICCGKLRK